MCFWQQWATVTTTCEKTQKNHMETKETVKIKNGNSKFESVVGKSVLNKSYFIAKQQWKQ